MIWRGIRTTSGMRGKILKHNKHKKSKTEIAERADVLSRGQELYFLTLDPIDGWPGGVRLPLAFRAMISLPSEGLAALSSAPRSRCAMPKLGHTMGSSLRVQP
jgi:hypothetical protein